MGGSYFSLKTFKLLDWRFSSALTSRGHMWDRYSNTKSISSQLGRRVPCVSHCQKFSFTDYFMVIFTLLGMSICYKSHFYGRLYGNIHIFMDDYVFKITFYWMNMCKNQLLASLNRLPKTFKENQDIRESTRKYFTHHSFYPPKPWRRWTIHYSPFTIQYSP